MDRYDDSRDGDEIYLPADERTIACVRVVEFDGFEGEMNAFAAVDEPSLALIGFDPPSVGIAELQALCHWVERAAGIEIDVDPQKLTVADRR